jgi:uridine phosphorylase
MEYPPSELPLGLHLEAYHLGLSPSAVASKVILVGDPDRVELVSSFFDTVEQSHHHREFISRTGVYKGKRILVLSTGIGVGNIDITVNELDALVNIDLEARHHKDEVQSLEIVRIGTCGILQADIPIHSYILSTFAVALDNVACYYDVPYTAEEHRVNAAINAQVTLPDTVRTNATRANSDLCARLASDLTVPGITMTSCGFYGPQGRQLRLKTKTEHLNERLSAFRYHDEDTGIDHRITNFEMESSALFALGRALGHKCATICLGIANRPAKTFSPDYNPAMKEFIRYVLDRI